VHVASVQEVTCDEEKNGEERKRKIGMIKDLKQSSQVEMKRRTEDREAWKVLDAKYLTEVRELMSTRLKY